MALDDFPAIRGDVVSISSEKNFIHFFFASVLFHQFFIVSLLLKIFIIILFFRIDHLELLGVHGRGATLAVHIEVLQNVSDFGPIVLEVGFRVQTLADDRN
jgi:hypothetical protein